MKNGTEKKPNPHESPIGRYLRSLERPAKDLVRFNNGQLVKRDTLNSLR